jgi:small subunit ribosomal protein S17
VSEAAAPPVADAPVKADAGSGDVPQSERANGRKVREGVVTSTSMDKTAIVTVTERVRHRLYRKTLQRSKKLYAHDEANTCRVGDRVRIAETRPLSKLKRWRLLEVLERAK